MRSLFKYYSFLFQTFDLGIITYFSDRKTISDRMYGEKKNLPNCKDSLTVQPVTQRDGGLFSSVYSKVEDWQAPMCDSLIWFPQLLNLMS